MSICWYHSLANTLVSTAAKHWTTTHHVKVSDNVLDGSQSVPVFACCSSTNVHCSVRNSYSSSIPFASSQKLEPMIVNHFITSIATPPCLESSKTAHRNKIRPINTFWRGLLFFGPFPRPRLLSRLVPRLSPSARGSAGHFTPPKGSSGCASRFEEKLREAVQCGRYPTKLLCHDIKWTLRG